MGDFFYKIMINYITEINKKVIIYYNDTFSECDGYELLITKIMKDHFFKYDYYKKRIKELFKFTRNVPIYLSHTLLLIRLKDNDNVYYINYKELLYTAYNEERILFIFKNGSYLFINKRGNNIRRIEEMTKKILAYITYLENDYYN